MYTQTTAKTRSEEVVSILLNFLLTQMMDEAKGYHFSSQARQPALSLLALRYIAKIQREDFWDEDGQLELEESDIPLYIRLEIAAESIEKQVPELEGVFSRVLLSGTKLMHVNLLRSWIAKLSLFPKLSGADDSSFAGRWFEAQLRDDPALGQKSSLSSTPATVAQLMLELADAQPSHSILDPCAGVGTILATLASRTPSDQQAGSLAGQEIQPVAWAICKLRLFLLGHDTRLVREGDCLKQPAFTTGMDLMRFDRVFCDMPLGQSLRGVDFAEEDAFGRFRHASLGRGSAEVAFVQHALASCKPDGTTVVLTGNGLLFRGNVDRQLRNSLIEQKLVRTVVALPGKLLAYSAIETALLVLGKSEDGVLLIDARGMQEEMRAKAHLLPETIAEICRIHRERASITGVSRLVDHEEIGAHDYSLIPQQYIAQEETEREVLDVSMVREEIRELSEKHARAVQEMDALLDEIAAG